MEASMSEKIYHPGESYRYPLIIKKLLNTPLTYSPDQEIVYDDRKRYSYRILNERINRLASGLEQMGVTQGDIVAVFDYDSHRYLECFFAIPMMGAVLQTINWRLSTEQILYTLNHAEAKVIIIHAEFLHVLEDIRDRREGVTYSHCVPTILQMLLSCPIVNEVDLSSWKVTIGGARLPKGLARAARKLGIEIHAGYGMSETCPVISTATPMEYMLDWEDDALLEVIIKTGRPLPLVEFEVFDANDKALPHDGKSTGEVVMRAPWLTESYFKEPAKTKELWRNGWLHSGDVGHIDGYGYLQITDRIKDVIKSRNITVNWHLRISTNLCKNLPKKENCPNTACRIFSNLWMRFPKPVWGNWTKNN
jgi:acyl-CoA synthetase (AMP-forming)/AMP-acid ligase II